MFHTQFIYVSVIILFHIQQNQNLLINNHIYQISHLKPVLKILQASNLFIPKITQDRLYWLIFYSYFSL